MLCFVGIDHNREKTKFKVFGVKVLSRCVINSDCVFINHKPEFSSSQWAKFMYHSLKLIGRYSSISVCVINAKGCDRPKDITLRKKTKTETQFKREFLKSEDALCGKKIICSVSAWGSRLSLLLWTFISLTFMNYFQLFLSPVNSNGSFGLSSFMSRQRRSDFV